jgi:hypothetical protein
MKICIVGGGTAGWLAALMLSNARPNHDYTVIESSKIGTVGVGEGTTGLFGKVLDEAGINQEEFMAYTEALPKIGIRFKNWNGDDSSFDASLNGSYTADSRFHLDSSMYSTLMTGNDFNYCQEEATLSSNNKTNMYIDSKNNLASCFDWTQAYHFNATKVGEFLKLKTPGVTCIDSEVNRVEHEKDMVKALHLSNGKKVEADLFIDCSGFKRLIPQALNKKYKSYGDILPVNRAFLFGFDHDVRKKTPCTTAWARDAGWIFEIPTRNRTGRGYIYSSKFASDSDVKQELEKIYGEKVNHNKTLEFDSCRLEESAFGNCLVLGLSSCFFEPLQATSIHNTIVQIHTYILDVLSHDQNKIIDPVRIQCYNEKIGRLYDDTASFIALHYECGRTDTPFWKFVTKEKTKDSRASSIVKLAKARLTRESDFPQYFGAAGYPLWNLIIGGMRMVDADVIKDEFQTWNIEPEKELGALQYEYERVTTYMKNLKLMEQFEIDAFFRKKVVSLVKAA